MEFLKKKKFYIPTGMIVYFVLLFNFPNFIGVATMLVTVATGIHLFKRNQTFKAKGKLFKTLTTLGLAFMFVFCGITGAVYDPVKSKEMQLTAERTKVENQKAKEEQEKKALEEKKTQEDQKKQQEEQLKKEQEEKAQKEVEEKAKVEAAKKAEEDKKKAEAENAKVATEQANARATAEQSSAGNGSSGTTSKFKSTEESHGSNTVIIAGKGKKYHRDGCRTLKGEKKEVTREDAISQGYDACKVCNP